MEKIIHVIKIIGGILVCFLFLLPIGYLWTDNGIFIKMFISDILLLFLIMIVVKASETT